MSEGIKNKLIEVEKEVMASLKDFQRATVERIDFLFRNGQDRLLVADEVGLGKTMIAKGVIAKFANQRYDEGDDLVKVVYICSNQSIANQNIDELDIFKTGYDNIENTRLSMQHLMIKKTEDDSKGKYVQLIPLTPHTSFNQTSGKGNATERFIMYQVLKQLPLFADVKDDLEKMLCAKATKSWEESKYCKDFIKLVSKYENYENRNANDENDIFNQLLANDNLLIEIASYLKNSPNDSEDKNYIIKLRELFATISVNMLNPDLVIMDEFQRFQFLISDKDSETKTLIDKFFNPANDDIANKVRILLLSATPYKLYSTLNEIGDTNNDEPYKEFNQVMKFLYNNEEKYNSFCDVWGYYASSLKNIETKGIEDLIGSKAKAELALYGNMSRTERMSVMGSGDYIDDHTKDEPLKINQADILAHIDVAKILSNTDIGISFPIDYIKSCPYALSYMNNYETKQKIRRYFDNNKKAVSLAKSKLLWLDKKNIQKYKEIKGENARLERLKDEIFNKQDTSLLLWIPPCKPYYNFGGVFQDKKNYSKILIFSCWEMVPRMIGSLISYEEERKTIYRLIKGKNDKKKQGRIRINYFAKSRYPSQRLVTRNYASLGLLYPSKTLSSIYDAISFYKRGITNINEIEEAVSIKIRELINDAIRNHEDSTEKEDLRWYHLIPMIHDGKDYVNQLEDPLLEEFQKILNDNEYTLGKIPNDIVEVLTNMTIASPANCLMRIFNSASISFEMANEFVKYFNSPEATAIIELSTKNTEDEGNHWKNTLAYCKHGNIQAMLDEYIHLITKGKGVPKGFSKEEEREKKNVIVKITTALSLRDALYTIESFDDFEKKVNTRKNARNKKEIEKIGSSLRTHFATAFSKGESDEGSNRKDSLRTAFNSPFWPFVLASTSIGQEGLDFHLYCRKIMHWNLPSNPIDIEQREGRINRYKCLAIRQNVVEKYGDTPIKDDSKDIWTDLFNAANQEREVAQSELIPFWCFGPNQKIKIERILANYPMSKDEEKYEWLINVLSLYRLTMGQARQEELLTHILHNVKDMNELKELFINLSPYSHQQSGI